MSGGRAGLPGRFDWRAPALMGAGAALALAAGGTWWLALAAPVAALAPGRAAPAAAAVLLLFALPHDPGLAATLLCFGAGGLAAIGALTRLGNGVPWLALPYAAGLLLLATLAWATLPPDGLWTGSDAAARLRILGLGALGALLMVPTYHAWRRRPSSAVAPEGTGVRQA